MKLLSGKAEADFIKWAAKKSTGRYKAGLKRCIGILPVDSFFALPEALQHTLIILWLDEVGLYLSAITTISFKNTFWRYTLEDSCKQKLEIMENFKNRGKATVGGIKMAVKIYNERYADRL